MAVLVTGGAGYIGSVMVEQLAARGEQVVVLDDLSRGHRAAVAETIPFYQGRTGDREMIRRITKANDIDSCIHFAAFAYVSESVSNPSLYFENNVAQGITLLDELVKAGVRSIVFSSTCSTYGEPVSIPIDEQHPQKPTNPYGWSKLMMEKILSAYDTSYGLKYVALRYFNAAGATAEHGEDHDPETHLIPNVLSAATGKLPFVQVFGDQYPTPDGTAIRDYIHISDLCSAHVLALDHLRNGGPSECLNLGNGTGYSVMEVIETARPITNRQIEVKIAPARAGDPSRLVADSTRAQKVLGWRPDFVDLESIIRSAWDWHQSHPDGYGSSATTA